MYIFYLSSIFSDENCYHIEIKIFARMLYDCFEIVNKELCIDEYISAILFLIKVLSFFRSIRFPIDAFLRYYIIYIGEK